MSIGGNWEFEVQWLFIGRVMTVSHWLGCCQVRRIPPAGQQPWRWKVPSFLFLILLTFSGRSLDVCVHQFPQFPLTLSLYFLSPQILQYILSCIRFDLSLLFMFAKPDHKLSVGRSLVFWWWCFISLYLPLPCPHPPALKQMFKHSQQALDIHRKLN